jgi:hypothetical protein
MSRFKMHISALKRMFPVSFKNYILMLFLCLCLSPSRSKITIYRNLPSQHSTEENDDVILLDYDDM